ncbi:class Ib ribonucleoside-diphosphate reductase assembly flavoprotein NrdI [Streptococcus ratti]|uniref:Putative NrdI-like protein n=1 Tax=Streptococcus ratti FA-1 = DSM 20564 TaxID=699248 RepID=A0ABN0GT73_STRRT|nr:class Ib ribonucleoside-diphosphate reductase assembly flavoprotein NrdI [Streptococcus ratti]EJN93485.1 ribonucleotide reductase stimulatory protein [Streptococcus ratti FA-1 = DSM 20564]EMP71768.1 ribonucleoprotein [Streptococcus ratti FA-1 = DSM 20564]QEY07362.1 ribonucleotide reductase [Streptococcus ratti]VEI59807.1 NrdI protein [Streptococcus mutans]
MTKIVYASRSGHVEKIVNQLGVADALKIETGEETLDGDYVIFTYSTGRGKTPKVVEQFLAHNPGVKAVVGSGSMAKHAETFNFAAENIAKAYKVPILAKLDGVGTSQEIEDLAKSLANCNHLGN